MEAGTLLLYTGHGDRFTPAETQSLKGISQLREYGWSVVVAQLGSSAGYWMFPAGPPHPTVTLRFPALDKKVSVEMRADQKDILGLPNGDAFLLFCSRGKSWALYYTRSEVMGSGVNITEWDRTLLVVLQGIASYYELNRKLPGTWKEVQEAGANIWLLPPTPSRVTESAAEIQREGETLAITYFPHTEHQFTTSIEPAGERKPEHHTLTEDRWTDVAELNLSSLLWAVLRYTTALDEPEVGVSIREWAGRIAPINPDAFLWAHLASDRVLSEVEARKTRDAMKPGQIFLSREGPFIVFTKYYLQSSTGKPGVEETRIEIKSAFR